MISLKSTRSGFTIVELLVVIVVIGILASITVVSFMGVSQKATAVSLQSDLVNAKKQIEIYKVLYESYPTMLDSNNCPLLPVQDTNYCLKTSASNLYTSYMSDGATFSLESANNNDNSSNIKYIISNNQSPQPKITLAITDPVNWITIGNQVWARKNANEGVMINGPIEQTNNGGTNIVEKYCYDNNASNCSTYGGLYQWNEAMKYNRNEGAQGICPTGSHIPTDDEWKILEMQSGMTQVQADGTLFRGTDQGTKLKVGGSSGLEIPLAGNRFTDGVLDYLFEDAYLWTSSEINASDAWRRVLRFNTGQISRYTGVKDVGFSVRCIEN